VDWRVAKQSPPSSASISKAPPNATTSANSKSRSENQ
jgi:hypothetical protein